MSIRLPVINLTAAVVGTTDTITWQQITNQSANSAHYGPRTIQGAPDNAAHLFIFNESPCELLITMQTGETFVLPAGGWHDQELQPSCTSLTYTVDAILTGALVNRLYTVWYAPYETPPRVPILGNSPIGGSVATANSTILIGVGQLYGLTEFDQTSDGPGPGLIPVSIGSGPAPLYLLVRDNAGGAHLVAVFDVTTMTLAVDIDCDPGTVKAGILQVSNAHVVLTDKFTNYNAEVLTNGGVPALVAGTIPNGFLVATIGAKTVFSYTTPNDGAKHSYRITVSVFVNNGTTGNNLTCTINYVDISAAPHSGNVPFHNGGVAVVVMNGATSLGNADYRGLAMEFTANPNTIISLSYNDPTNTPNDTVFAHLERLS